jgi:hypothetical protein
MLFGCILGASECWTELNSIFNAYSAEYKHVTSNDRGLIWSEIGVGF